MDFFKKHSLSAGQSSFSQQAEHAYSPESRPISPDSTPDTIGSFELPSGLTFEEKQQIANMTLEDQKLLVQQLKLLQQGAN